MSLQHNYTFLRYHLIFATQSRDFLIDESIEQDVWNIVSTSANQQKCKPFAVGGFDDHIHMLLEIPTTIAISSAIGHIKGSSSYRIKREIFRDENAGFNWQQQYSIWTVSPSRIPSLKQYIANQRNHHTHSNLTLEKELGWFDQESYKNEVQAFNRR